MARGGGNRFACPVCSDRLRYIGRDAEKADEPLVFTCGNCDTFFRRAEPEGWIDPAIPLHNAQKAMEEGRSIKQDARISATEIEDVIKHLRDIDPTQLNDEQLKAFTGFLVIGTLLKNLVSTRPLIRQRAAEKLMEYTFAKPAARVDVTSKGEKLEGVDLISAAESKLARMKELLAKKDEA